MNATSELLQGRCAVVTGAARGNGEALARGLAAHGARVALADVDAAQVREVAADIVSQGGRAIALGLDVSDAVACAAFAQAVEAELGAVSLLVNNAGIVRKTDPYSPDFAAQVEVQLRVNVLGYANMVHVLLPQLKATRGCIINIASIMSFVSYKGATGYAASKGAVKQLTVGLASDLASDGIRVNAIAPGFFETSMTQGTREDPELLKRRLEHVPMGRMGVPNELVGPVVFLASSMASYVTGAMLAVDGGYLAV